MPLRTRHDLDTAFADLAQRESGLRIVCEACARRVEIPGDDLVTRYGAQATLRMIYDRLVCAACSGRDINAYEIGLGSRHPGPALKR